MSTWKVILATLIIFTAGLITGGLLVKGPKKANKPKEVNLVRTEILRRLTRELDLNAQQQLKVNEILQESNERGKILREIIEPELRAEYKKAVDDIRAQLTPGQRTRFDDLLKQRRKAAPGEKRRQNAPTNLVRAPTNQLQQSSNNPTL